MITVNDVKETLHELEHDESVVFENPDYVSAIVGMTEDGRVVYSYDKMITHLVETDGMTEEDAIDFISYNTERAIPYAGAMAPISFIQFPALQTNNERFNFRNRLRRCSSR